MTKLSLDIVDVGCSFSEVLVLGFGDLDELQAGSRDQVDFAPRIADIFACFVTRGSLLLSPEHMIFLGLKQANAWGIGIEEIVVAYETDDRVQSLHQHWLAIC